MWITLYIAIPFMYSLKTVVSSYIRLCMAMWNLTYLSWWHFYKVISCFIRPYQTIYMYLDDSDIFLFLTLYGHIKPYVLMLYIVLRGYTKPYMHIWIIFFSRHTWLYMAMSTPTYIFGWHLYKVICDFIWSYQNFIKPHVSRYKAIEKIWVRAPTSIQFFHHISNSMWENSAWHVHVTGAFIYACLNDDISGLFTVVSLALFSQCVSRESSYLLCQENKKTSYHGNASNIE